MNQLWKQRIIRIWIKTILVFFFTLSYMFLLGVFWSYIKLPPLLTFLLLSIWYMLMIFLVEYYIRTAREKDTEETTVDEINEEEGDIDIIFPTTLASKTESIDSNEENIKPSEINLDKDNFDDNDSEQNDSDDDNN